MWSAKFVRIDLLAKPFLCLVVTIVTLLKLPIYSSFCYLSTLFQKINDPENEGPRN